MYILIDNGRGTVISTHGTYSDARAKQRRPRSYPTTISYTRHPFRVGDVVQDDDPRLEAAHDEASPD